MGSNAANLQYFERLFHREQQSVIKSPTQNTRLFKHLSLQSPGKMQVTAGTIPQTQGGIVLYAVRQSGLFAALLAVAFLWGQPVRADEVDDLNTQVNELTQAGLYAQASALAQTAADKARTIHGVQSSPYARALAWQGYLMQMRGKTDQAERLFESSLDIYQKILPPGHPDIATSINNLGFNYQNSDRLIEAEQMYKRALDMREKAEPRSELHIADSLNNLAQCYKRQGRVREAEPLLKRALELRAKSLKPNDPLMAQSLTNIGSALELQEQFAQAEPYYRKALEIRRASQPADHPDIAGSLNKLAEILFKRGKYQEAEALFRDVIEIRYRTQHAGHIDIATSLLARAQNLVELKQYGEAKSALRNALAIQQMALPPLHPSIAHSQAELGRIARIEGDAGQALAMLRVAAVSQAARGKSDDLARQHFANFVGAAYDTMARSRAAPDAKLVNQALEMAQRSGLTETAATVTRMAARFTAQDPALGERMREREEIESELARSELELSATLAVPAADRPVSADEVRTRLDELARRLSTVDADLKVRFPRYANLVSPEPLSVEDVKALLAPDEALAYYFAGTDGLYLWAVTHDGALWRKLEPSVKTVSGAVDTLRGSLDIQALVAQGEKARLFDLGLAHQLYTWLLGPAETLLAGKRQVIVVPAGPLTSLPFQTLVKSAPKLKQPGLRDLASYRDADWLMNHHALSVMPALTSFRAMRAIAPRTDPGKPMIGFGNPIFEASVKSVPGSPTPPAASGAPPATPDQRPLSFANFWRGPAADMDALRSGLPALPETEAELKFVAGKLRAAVEDIKLGADATEAAVKSADLTPYRVIYFATHGLVAGELKGLGEPALALTLPANPSEVDDGLLTASEISQLKLNADWVILSACNTADPGSAGAEALSGLAKSFFHAGARALLVSHWRVGSAATTRMTTATFDIMERTPGIGRAEALRQAMRAFMADKSDPWNGYPTFWAPFVVVGEGGQRS
jgi:CHAT domain-containing protein/tetratricopeptide (TPR) repeat protein